MDAIRDQTVEENGARSQSRAWRRAFALTAALMLLPVGVRAADAWATTAGKWEENAAAARAGGDTAAELVARREAARAWTRCGDVWADSCPAAPARLDELEVAVAAGNEAIKAWRRAALDWKGARDLARALGEDTVAAEARAASGDLLLKLSTAEEALRANSRRLAERRRSLLDMPVSESLQLDLVNRWAEVARGWDQTAQAWERAAEPAKAQVARMKAAEARDRIRELRPGLDNETWLARAVPATATGPLPAVPDLPAARPAPPAWLLTRDERAALAEAARLRQGADAWHATALARAADRDEAGTAEAVAAATALVEQARQLENEVRRTYARREADISSAVARALNEKPRGETTILALLDAASPGAALPPVITSDAISLTVPRPPEVVKAEERKRGFLDLEIGGPVPSTLNIRGRKVVDIDFSMTHHPNTNQAQNNSNSTDFSLNQELQVEVTGMVGKPDNDHINVNIRYDDTQKGVNAVNNRTIDVNYDGAKHQRSWGTYEFDPAFGDIAVSMPGSEFALYNKSLFGVKGNLSIEKLKLGLLQADRINLLLFGSQTKGVSATKEFTLTGERVVEDLTDASFARGRFILLEPDPDNLSLANVTVYKDDRNITNNYGTTSFMAAGAGACAGFTHTGDWHVLTAGVDYTLNLSTGELEMLTALSDNDVVAVSYAGPLVSYGYGGALPPRLVRVPTDTDVQTRTAFRAHELRNRYLLSRNRVKKNDANLVFEIRDPLGFTQTTLVGGVATTYLRLFGFDRDNDGKVDIEDIDYDYGIIRAPDTAPFMRTGNTAVDNSAIYTKSDVTDADKKYTIHIEYTSDQPQEVFSLGFDIIKGSDIVYVDGVQVTRDKDYYIDYEAGVITFINTAIIQMTSKIRVDYEYLPLGGQFEHTLLGGRVDVDLTPNIGFGSTLLYDFSADADEAPTIFEEKPTQNIVTELDGRLSLTPIIMGLIDRKGQSAILSKWRQNFRLDLSGEWAWAAQQPNTFGAALIDDFSEIENIISASFSLGSWVPSSRSPSLGLALAGRGTVSFAMVDNFGHLTENQLEDDEKQTALAIALSYAAGDTWIGIRQALSRSAMDFTNMTSLEFYVSGLPDGVRMFLDVGVISEDANEDGVMTTEDVGLDGIPNTNDAGENNGVLNTGEDKGIDIGGAIYGANDGVLTTEDMDGDYVLDQREAYFQFSDTSAGVESTVITGAKGSTWTMYRIPWRSGRAVGEADSEVIKHVRLTFVSPTGVATSATLYMDQLSFRGALFEGASDDTRLAILPRNTVSDPNYVSPALTEVKPDEEAVKEQSLALKWKLAPYDSVTVKQTLSKAANLNNYKRLSFYLAGDARGESFSIFLVSDANNFVEIRRIVNTGSPIYDRVTPPIWDKIDVSLVDLEQAIIDNFLGPQRTEFILQKTGYILRVVSEPALGRSPSLGNINAMWLRVQGHATADSGEIWLDDIYVAEPIKKSGMAYKAAFATGWSDIFTLSGSLKDVPGNFQGVGFINNPQTESYDEISSNTKNLSFTLALGRLLPSSWKVVMPLSGSWTSSKTSLDPNNVSSTLKSNLGTTTSENQSYNASLQAWKLPGINLSYNRTTAQVKYRLENRNTVTSVLAGNTAYAFVFPKKLFNVLPTGEYLSFNSSYSLSRTQNSDRYAATSGLASVVARTTTQSIGTSLTARPINPLSISYNYSTGLLNRRTLLNSEYWSGITNRTHGTSLSLNIPRFFGISPGASFNGNYSENFYRATFGGKNKDANLGGDFRINVGLDPSAWSKLLSFFTVNYSYSLSSNASYRNMNTGQNFYGLLQDYVAQRLFPWGKASHVGMGSQGVAGSRSSGSTSNSHNVSGDLRTFNWLGTSYSASFTRNEVASLSTLALTDGINGTLNLRMDCLRALPKFLARFRSSYITTAISYGRTESANNRSNSFGPTMNWNTQWNDAFNTTVSLGYSRATSIVTQAPEQKTVTSVISPGLNFTYYFDLPMAKLAGSKLGTMANLQKRVSLSGGLTSNFNRGEVGGKVSTNQDKYGLNLSLGYRLSSSLEFTASSNGSWLHDRMERLNDNYTLGGSARAEWRF